MSSDMEGAMKTLVVDDSSGDRKLVEKAFERVPVPTEFYAVENGKEAVEFLRREGEYEEVPRPGLVLLDLNMPVKGGKEVLEEIRNEASLGRIPVVALTSSEDEADIVDVYELGANAYITKPTGFSELVEKVTGVCEFWYRVAKVQEQ
jgi:CheY-like chemotaxis protein